MRAYVERDRRNMDEIALDRGDGYSINERLITASKDRDSVTSALEDHQD